ncbi:hypothetical protein BD770DRAFT_409351 [Pilaira anomala]|nr:hypothetical protein BD770DRAFT_409351 [Pilaira anomala]
MMLATNIIIDRICSYMTIYHSNAKKKEEFNYLTSPTIKYVGIEDNPKVYWKNTDFEGFIYRCCFQGVQSFCIYNRLTEGMLQIEQGSIPGVPVKRKFYKLLERGNLKDTVTTIETTFDWRTDMKDVFTPICYTGGDSHIFGSVNDYYAVCELEDVARNVSIIRTDRLF